jgi:hypothetical protein
LHCPHTGWLPNFSGGTRLSVLQDLHRMMIGADVIVALRVIFDDQCLEPCRCPDLFDQGTGIYYK